MEVASIVICKRDEHNVTQYENDRLNRNIKSTTKCKKTFIHSKKKQEYLHVLQNGIKFATKIHQTWQNLSSKAQQRKMSKRNWRGSARWMPTRFRLTISSRL